MTTDLPTANGRLEAAVRALAGVAPGLAGRRTDHPAPCFDATGGDSGEQRYVLEFTYDIDPEQAAHLAAAVVTAWEELGLELDVARGSIFPGPTVRFVDGEARGALEYAVATDERPWQLIISSSTGCLPRQPPVDQP